MKGKINSSFSKYLTVSGRDKAWQVYCTCIGSSVISPGAEYPLRPDQHPSEYSIDWMDNPGKGRILSEYQIVYITEGTGSFCVQGEELYRIKAGSVFILFPGIPHWYCPDADCGWIEYWAGFQGAYIDKLVENQFLSPSQPVLTPGIHEVLVKDFLELFSQGKQEPRGYQQVCGGLIISILAKIIAFARQREEGDETQMLVERAKILFHEHVASSLEIRNILDSLSIDYSKFRKIFKESTGLSPYQYYLQMKINRAKELLQAGTCSVKETSFDLGFKNQYYFSKIFKEKTGFSPTEWQERSRVD